MKGLGNEGLKISAWVVTSRFPCPVHDVVVLVFSVLLFSASFSLSCVHMAHVCALTPHNVLGTRCVAARNSQRGKSVFAFAPVKAYPKKPARDANFEYNNAHGARSVACCVPNGCC